MELRGKGGAVNMHLETFGTIVDIAKKYSWTPTGTLPPHYWKDSEEWGSQYFSNDGQLVENDDALTFGRALERALKENKSGYLGAPRALIREMVDLCLDGGFRIW